MKIIFRLIMVVSLVLVLWVLVQNIEYVVDVHFFDQSYTDVKLPFVLLVAFGAGITLGSLLMALLALQYKAEFIKERKKQKMLMKELDSLRNLSLDEIGLDEKDNDENYDVETLPQVRADGSKLDG